MSTWIALRQDLTPGLEETFRRVLESRGAEIGSVGRRYGLSQMHVFQQDSLGLITLEVEDVDRFQEITEDPDFQVLSQELSGVVDFRPMQTGGLWPEVYAWDPDPSTVG